MWVLVGVLVYAGVGVRVRVGVLVIVGVLVEVEVGVLVGGVRNEDSQPARTVAAAPVSAAALRKPRRS